jgi:hypothetical protein
VIEARCARARRVPDRGGVEIVNWNQDLSILFDPSSNSHLLSDGDNCAESAVSSRQTKFLSENLMADVYLGIAIAGVNTLIVLGAAFAFVVI